ncbi:DUF350 domain-containing protein [Alteromonas lipolytica]|uniref:DUF350 domain-containing protein n=1 Tax=Alteromonas lipolytica TaxID=1856405 RepID=A0A1E8FDN9_9ALTE|nr:DUF350 domain-containing protein [Alteromonas lipolytica]OFI34040.1 hypothetical protein BFC17_21050 [Alteromonas lipolytica]GGF65974.1 ATP synthase F0 subunit A [Alteromonas lipolytica]
MDTLVKLVPLAHDLWVYVAIDVALALLLLLVMKWLSRSRAKVSVSDELGVKDNFAFGISVAGGMLSLCLVLSSVVGRHVGQGYEQAALGMLIFGVIGICLVKVGRFAHDKIVLDAVDTENKVAQRNVSVALVDAASLVSSAIILRSIMVWVNGSDLNAIIAIVTGFLVVLTILLIMTRVYEMRYALQNQNHSFQSALDTGQLALAVQHAGNLLGTALVVSSAGALLNYIPNGYVSNVTGWLITSVALSLFLWVLVAFSKWAILNGVNYQVEVDEQHNVGVAAVEFTLSIGLAMIISGVLSSSAG